MDCTKSSLSLISVAGSEDRKSSIVTTVTAATFNGPISSLANIISAMGFMAPCRTDDAVAPSAWWISLTPIGTRLNPASLPIMERSRTRLKNSGGVLAEVCQRVAPLIARQCRSGGCCGTEPAGRSRQSAPLVSGDFGSVRQVPPGKRFGVPNEHRAPGQHRRDAFMAGPRCATQA
jgi:hypothetical protein